MRLIRRSVARCVAVGVLLLATLLGFGTPGFADSDSRRSPEIADADHTRTIESPRERTHGRKDNDERRDREERKDKEARDRPDGDRNSPDDGGVCPP